MDLHQFDLNLLVALDALLTERSVTKAGARLNLSQSAMSGALARLRTFFQDELLVSVGRQMVLTPLAEELVEPVRNILLQVRETLGSKPRFDPAIAARHLSIAVSDYVTTILMPDVLRQARCEAPHITFELRPLGKHVLEELERGELDFRIVPEDRVLAGHPTETLFQETWTCVAWSGNTSIGATLSAEQYLNLGHVAVRIEGAWLSHDERCLQGSNHKRRVEVWAPSFSLAPQLVVGTDRIATIMTRLALRYAELLPLRLLPLPIDIPPIVETLQWHKAHDHDPAYHWFRRVLQDAVARLPPVLASRERPHRQPFQVRRGAAQGKKHT